MKKIMMTVVVVLSASILFAQVDTNSQLVSKKGIAILPETGDYSISIDAQPFLYYLGNMFNSNVSNPAPTFNFTADHPVQIVGKYMVDANTAYRGIVRMGYNNDVTDFYVMKDGQTEPNPSVVVKDSYTRTQSLFAIGGGLEKRRGKGRVQGFYGGQAIIAIGTDNKKYTYGNAITADNTIPTRTAFTAPITRGTQDAFVLENTDGTSFGLILEGFVGVEYFFAPKFSISGEFLYGLSFYNKGDGSKTIEYLDNTTIQAKQETYKIGNRHFVDFNPRAALSLNLNFYF